MGFLSEWDSHCPGAYIDMLGLVAAALSSR